jgi:signal peptidase I
MDPFGLPAAGLALLFRIFLIQPFTMSAGSMLPTLKVNDYIVGAKFSYGYSQYSTPLGSFLPAFEFAKSAPARGDVVIFALPSNPSTTYIKRVIGLPGDRVQVKDGITYLNDKPLKRELLGMYQADAVDMPPVPEYRETLPNGRSYTVIEIVDGSESDNTRVFTVPPGHVFVMGDNRDNSSDSRFSVGYLPIANIFAKAWMVVDYSGETAVGREIK